MRLALLLAALLLWPPIAGAAALFLINGLGSSGAFTEPFETAIRSLRLAATSGFDIGIRSMPFLSLAPAAIVFAARRWTPNLGDVAAGAMGALFVFALFVVWIVVEPLDPLLGGIIPLVLGVLLTSGAFTGLLISRLRPRATPLTPTP